MAQPGRKSAAALAVIGVVTSVARVAPPDGLTDAQIRLWLVTVNSKPAEWFGDEHVPMLVEYVRHVSTADMLTRQIEAFDPAWLADEEGLRRMKTLIQMRHGEAQCINLFARSMRLTHQSVYHAQTAGTLADKTDGRKPWTPN